MFSATEPVILRLRGALSPRARLSGKKGHLPQGGAAEGGARGAGPPQAEGGTRGPEGELGRPTGGRGVFPTLAFLFLRKRGAGPAAPSPGRARSVGATPRAKGLVGIP